MSSMSVHERSRVHCAVYVIKTRFQLRSRSHALLVGRSDVQQLERRLYITPCIFLTFTLSMYGPFSINIYIATSPSRLPRARCYLRPPTVMSKLNFGAKKRPSPAGTLYNFVWKGKWEYSNCLRITIYSIFHLCMLLSHPFQPSPTPIGRCWASVYIVHHNGVLARVTFPPNFT